MGGGREGRREGGREGRRDGGREGGREEEGWTEGGREGGREGGWEAGREDLDIWRKLLSKFMYSINNCFKLCTYLNGRTAVVRACLCVDAVYVESCVL